jgi:hypothetical protein
LLHILSWGYSSVLGRLVLEPWRASFRFLAWQFSNFFGNSKSN